MTIREVAGRVLNLRKMGGIAFLSIFSGTEHLSLVCDRLYTGIENFKNLCGVKAGDYVVIHVDNREKDICASQLVRHYRVRKQQQRDKKSMTIGAYAFILSSIRNALNDRHFLEVRLPSIHYGHTKGETFTFNFFKQQARLSSSNALFVDACAMSFCKVYSIQRCFRAEKSHTRKHLSEFDMLELANLDMELDAGMSLIENLIKDVLRKLKESEFTTLLHDTVEWQGNMPFARRSYDEVAGQFGIRGRGLGRFELQIADKVPVFIYGFPKNIASWTSEVCTDGTTASFNLLMPNVGEVAEGTQRLHNVDKLKTKFQILGLNKQLAWYVDAIDYPNCRTTGFGLGIERLAMWLLGVKNIREVQPFYRDTNFSEIC